MNTLRRFRKRILPLQLLLGLFSLEIAHASAGAGPGANSETSTKAEVAPARAVKLGLNWKPEPQFGGFYAGDLMGHFKKRNISIEILPGGAGTPTVQMVAAGKMDFGIVSADEVILSKARGADVVALFATYQTNPQGIMVHGDKGFKGLKDVFASKETTVALQKGLPYTIYLQRKFGPPKARIVPYQGGISLFLADKNFAQQCFMTSEPLEARRRGVNSKVLLVADEGYNPYLTVLVTRREVLTNSPGLVRDVVAAVRAGWRDYLRDPTRANKRMGELNPSMDAVTFKESAEAQKPLIEPRGTGQTSSETIGTMTKERWATLVDQLYQMKIITTKPNPLTLFVNL